MKLKIDFSLPKLVRVKLGLRLGLDEGAALDVRLRLRGGAPLKWRAALLPSRGKQRALERDRAEERDQLTETTMASLPTVAE